VIVDGILNLMFGILEPLFDLLPSGTFPIETTGYSGFLEPLRDLDYLLPFMAPLSWLVGVASVTLAGLLAYRVGIFLYSKLRGA